MVNTYLSDEINHFMKLCTINSNTNKYINENLSICWNKINNIFAEQNENFNIHNQNEEWFKIKMKLIQDLMSEARNNLNIAPESIISKLWKNLEWTDRLCEIEKCYEYYTTNIQTNLLKCVLILTSIIERSLGNILKIYEKNVPYLLKDLLETKQLHNLLGNGFIRVMQLIFGTSKCLNIRNISWHGFLSYGELNSNHIAILFILITSVGEILHLKNISFINIPYRPQITNINDKILEITNRNHVLNILEDMESVRSVIRNCDIFIGPTHIKFWEEILLHTKEQCNNNCIILIVPIFEHLLRRIFCKLNNCNEKKLFAMQKEKYITLDDIFTPNKIFDVISNGSIDFYEDLFSHLSGPRIRDKLSHGEIILQSINCQLTELLLCLSVYCILESYKYLNILENKKNLLENLERNFENYESLYHPNVLLKYKILNAYCSLQRLLNIPKPNADEIETIEIEIITFDISKFSIYNKDLKSFVETFKVPTISRPSEELKIIKKLIQITEKNIEVSEQIILDNVDRYESFLNKSLSSRQINKYDEILKSISIVYNSLNTILHMVIYLMYKHFSNTLQYSKHIFKFLLRTLCYEEKLLRNSNVKLNKWFVVRTLTADYKKQLNTVFEKHMKNT